MAIAWMVLNGLDLLFTSKALELGAIEGNPVLALFLGHSFFAFAFAKIAIALGVLGIYLAFKRHNKIKVTLTSGNVLLSLVVMYQVTNIYIS